MKKIIFFFSYLLLSQTSYSKQWLVVYAEKMSQEAIVGHAFVSFIQEDAFQKQTKLVGCWGFYPRIKVPQAIWGTVPAELRDDWKTNKDYSFLVEVTTAEFNHCLRIKELYKKKLEYSLNGQSCVNFVRDIIAAIPRLKQPSKIYVFPDEMVLELKRLNQSIEQQSIASFNSLNKQSVPESDNSLSEGAKLLFKDIKCKLTVTEKNFIYTKLGFHLSKDKKGFTDGESEEDAFSAEVLPTDMNKDGLEEIFVSYGNTYTSGMTGSEIVLFIKTNGRYQENLGFPGLIPDALSSSNQGYPDLLIGGPGFEFPIWRWNGNKYNLHRRVKDKDVKAIKTTNIEEISKEYRTTIR